MLIARDARLRGIAGRAAVRLRGAVRSVLRPPRPCPPAEEIRRILVVKRRGLGALVCATPALRALRERCPRAELVLLTSPELQPLYEDAPLGVRPRALPDLSAGGVRQGMRDLLPEPPDVALDLDGVDPVSRRLVWAAGARFLAGLAVRGRGGLDAAVPPEPGRHAAEVFSRVAALAGAECPDAPVLEAPRVREAERARVAEWLAEWRVPEAVRLIGVNMNAGAFAPRRAWPGEKFILLAQDLEERAACRTVFFGAPEDDTYVARHLKHMENPPVNLTGQTSVRQLAALLERLDLLVTNDAGPLHLAAALGTPTVSVFGPGSPDRFGPPETERHAVIYRPPACGACVDFLSGRLGACRKGEHCVRDIPLEEVRRTVLEMLEHLEEPESPPWAAGADPEADPETDRPRDGVPGPGESVS
jgi:heptosyltransferase-2/heptosyltransferase-3